MDFKFGLLPYIFIQDTSTQHKYLLIKEIRPRIILSNIIIG